MDNISKELAAQKVSQLISYAQEKLDLQIVDAIYASNALLDILHLSEPAPATEVFGGDLYADILNPLIQYSIENGLTDEIGADRFKTRIMGAVLPAPSVVIDSFDRKTAVMGIRKATKNFYDFCCNSTYIDMDKIKKNLVWKHAGKKGEIVITINVARPEKDPKEIEAAKLAPQTNYPKCMLCPENIGYAGRAGYPARQTLRFIPIPLNDDSLWYMQFSPYRYFNQHCIFFSEKHEPMVTGEASFLRMVELVKTVPHYFIGSNAPLPIVGGSILSHDHYQGGAKELPVFKRLAKKQFLNSKFPGVKFAIVDWYNSLIRLKGKDSKMVCKAANYINDMWALYSDESLGIISSTQGNLHNAITPVFRLERGDCFAELFLRNNRTDEEHPYGIFHPTENYHHIKKEGIGIIEVMGLFILPGRLSAIVKQLMRYVRQEKKFDAVELNDKTNPMYPYREFIVELLSKYTKENADNAKWDIIKYLSVKCEEILTSTAVFKDTPEGNAGFDKFMEYLGCTYFNNEEEGAKIKEAAKAVRAERAEKNRALHSKKRRPAVKGKAKGKRYVKTPGYTKQRRNDIPDNVTAGAGGSISELSVKTAVANPSEAPKVVTAVPEISTLPEKAVTPAFETPRVSTASEKAVEAPIEANPAPADEADTQTEPVKRKRGRPRKNPISE